MYNERRATNGEKERHYGFNQPFSRYGECRRAFRTFVVPIEVALIDRDEEKSPSPIAFRGLIHLLIEIEDVRHSIFE